MSNDPVREALEKCRDHFYDLCHGSVDMISEHTETELLEMCDRALAADTPAGETEELRTKLRMIVSHATGGSFSDIDASTNDICCRITANRNHVYEEGKKHAPNPPSGTADTEALVDNSWEPAPWPDPTPEMLASPEFEAVWQCIKSWDINVPEVYAGYCGATGNHARAILDALRALQRTPSEEDVWRPMDEAPRYDGCILIGWGEYRERDGFSPAFMRWYDSVNGWSVNAMPFYPVCWQPLPQPPKRAAINAIGGRDDGK